MKANLKISILQLDVFEAHQKVAKMSKLFTHERVNVYRKESTVAVDIPDFGVVYVEIKTQAERRHKLSTGESDAENQD